MSTKDKIELQHTYQQSVPISSKQSEWELMNTASELEWS